LRSVGIDLYALESSLEVFPDECSILVDGFEVELRMSKASDSSVMLCVLDNSRDIHVTFVSEVNTAYTDPGKSSRLFQAFIEEGVSMEFFTRKFLKDNFVQGIRENIVSDMRII
jgi:hypothetical protein